MSLRSHLEKVQKELERRESIKEEAQKLTRKVTRLSKQAILLIHQGSLDESKRLLKEAEDLFDGLRKICVDDPDLTRSSSVNLAFQEYVEAHVLLELVKEGRFIGPEELKAPAESYALGLADSIGELRRRSLDALRKGDIPEAERCLGIMEHIYLELMSMGEAYMLIPGLRRKCDLARRLIETTRGEVTLEIRRSSLEEAIRRFEVAIREGRGPEEGSL